jgi:hypothetical protein
MHWGRIRTLKCEDRTAIAGSAVQRKKKCLPICDRVSIQVYVWLPTSNSPCWIVVLVRVLSRGRVAGVELSVAILKFVCGR